MRHHAPVIVSEDDKCSVLELAILGGADLCCRGRRQNFEGVQNEAKGVWNSTIGGGSHAWEIA